LSINRYHAGAETLPVGYPVGEGQHGEHARSHRCPVCVRSLQGRVVSEAGDQAAGGAAGQSQEDYHEGQCGQRRLLWRKDSVARCVAVR